MSIREVQWIIPLRCEQNEPLLLFSACDTNYLGYAISLIRSVDLFSPGYPFVLHLINPDQSSLDRVQQLATTLKKVCLAVSMERVDVTGLSREQQRAYFASARFPQLARLLREFQVPIFSLDADSLVVNAIDLNFSDKADAEVVIIRRDLNKQVPEHLSVLNSSIWFKPTSGVCQFLDQMACTIDERLQDRSLKWFVDQVEFARLMQEMQNTVKFYNLKRKYADWDFHEKSIVWAGKGARKESDMRFFLLQAMLGGERNRRDLARNLWAHLMTSQADMAASKWLRQRVEAVQQVKEGQVIIYVPRLDQPWKQGKDPDSLPPPIAEDVLDLRLHWKAFAIRMANAIERAGLSVDVIELPAWEIGRGRIEASGASLALVPHRCCHDFEDGLTPVMFYMQEFFRWVFIVNERGWSAASSCYPLQLDKLPDTEGITFDLYRERLRAGELDSKFAQKNRKPKAQLIADGEIPGMRGILNKPKVRPYIFLPLQIPHDQSIKYFSKVTEQDLVENLILWAQKNNIAVVMKPHPANLKSMEPFKQWADGQNIFWSEAHVYDLIAHATGIYTINSGVGLESLLHLKPVVTFGQVEYDCVTFRAELNSLDSAWEYCQQAQPALLEKSYRHFFDWFMSGYAYDMSCPVSLAARMEQLGREVVDRVQQATDSL